MDVEFFSSRLMMLIPLLLCLSVHEWAHAWAACKLGDDTAKHLGRLTINPFAHIDPVGTFILPLLGVPFGWAKPVPFNPLRFRRAVSMKLGGCLVALSGPLANVFMALVCSLLLLFVSRLYPLSPIIQAPVLTLLTTLIYINCILVVFNLLPVPPLDGSHVFEFLVPKRFELLWQRYLTLGPLILICAFGAPYLFGVDLFSGFVSWVLKVVRQS